MSSLGLNFYSIFLPDFMHEFEIGAWKALFIHLLRILGSHGGGALIAELDRRPVVFSCRTLSF